MDRKRLSLLLLASFCGLMLLVAVSSSSAQEAKPQDTYILKGAPMGGVKFEHKLHQARAAEKCETCHHASKPEKPMAAKQQACTDCHTKTVAPPMKTNIANTFHKGPANQTGVCIDCHKAENAKGKKAPTKCMECHKKENV